MSDKQEKITFHELYGMVHEFLKKYPLTISWRLRQHCTIMHKHINENEKVIYVFPAQKNSNPFNIYDTCIVALTDKRILISQKNVLWGYKLVSVTPDMFNDFEVYKGLIFGKVDIDTIKEVIKLSDLDPRALVEVETSLSNYLVKIKPKFLKNESKKESK